MFWETVGNQNTRTYICNSLNTMIMNIELIKKDEIFKDIPNSTYMISNYGRVYSKPYKRWSTHNNTYSQMKGRVKTLSNNNSKKYWRVTISYGSDYEKGKRRSVCESVHRLVALCFIPNPENKPQVNHIDGDRNNNHVSNLEWVTNQENMTHRYEVLQNFNNLHGTKSNRSKLTEDQAINIANRILKGERIGLIHKDYEFISVSTISEIKSGRSWRHLGILPPSKIKSEKYFDLRYDPAVIEK